MEIKADDGLYKYLYTGSFKTIEEAANKKLDLAIPAKKNRKIPIEFTSDSDLDTELIEIIIDEKSEIINKQIVELDFPDDCRIILIWRNNNSIVPSGGTTFQGKDKLLVLVNKENIQTVNQIFTNTQIFEKNYNKDILHSFFIVLSRQKETAFPKPKIILLKNKLLTTEIYNWEQTLDQKNTTKTIYKGK